MKQRVFKHILFWMAYLAFEAYIEYAWISASYANLSHARRFFIAAMAETTLLAVKVPLIYSIFFIIYQLGPKFKTIIGPLALGFLAVAVAVIFHRILVVKIILPYIYLDSDVAGIFHINRMISALLDLVFIAFVALVVKQYRQYLHWKEREKGLVKERLEAELKFLRTQTNPHFLFNTLNNIYALARKKSDDTADVVMKLSKLLRFMLYESKKDTITIAEELRVLDDYIELEKIRYNDRLQVRVEKSVDADNTPIAPLILLPFVENAFKHGASEARFDSYIHLRTELRNGQLNFTIENSKDDENEKAIVENIGLSNVRRQLELMYPEHLLQLSNERNRFLVKLTINLRNYAAV